MLFYDVPKEQAMNVALGVMHFVCAAIYVGLAIATPSGRIRRLVVAPVLVATGVGWLTGW